MLVRGRDDGVTAALAEHGARVVPPVRWEKGEARVEVALAEDTDAAALVKLFPDARLLSHAQRPDLPLEGLTEKQARALVTAFEMGYYESPKRVTTGDVAKRLGLARSTFEGHLSRAERKLLGAMLPLARERMGELDAAQAYCAFSDALGYFVRVEMTQGQAIRRVSLDRDGDITEPHPYLTRILDHVRTGRDDLSDLPLDLEVSPFDREVLDLLRTIPPGRTMTYGEVARALGKPGAARAVGNACAKNPAIIVVPCHRVVPSSGGLGNYSGAGGVATKAKLLAREKGDSSIDFRRKIQDT
jgi:O-6-methylguanine DNA methyltransferase